MYNHRMMGDSQEFRYGKPAANVRRGCLIFSGLTAPRAEVER